MEVAVAWRIFHQHCGRWHRFAGKDTHDGQAVHPTVVFTKGLEEATAVGSELIREILGASHDVVSLGTIIKVFNVIATTVRTNDTHDILAVPTRSVTTLVDSQLHETLFAITTDGGRIAATLLESDRSQKDGRDWERTLGGQFHVLSDIKSKA